MEVRVVTATEVQVLTVRDVAQILKVSPRTVQRLPIKYIRIGKLRRYRREWVDAYIEERSV